MRPFKLLSLLAVTSSMLCYVPPSVQACKDEGPTSALAPDELTRDDPNSCPTAAPCSPPSGCAQKDPNPDPFQRPQQLLTGPLTLVNSGPNLCFAVARKSNGEHYLFDTGSGAFRYSSDSNCLAWAPTFPPNYTFTNSPAYFTGGIQCPDPHFTGPDFNGAEEMWMYFITGVGPRHHIGRATSVANNGEQWLVDDSPILSYSSDYKPNQPSVIQIDDGYLMAYTEMCRIGGPATWEQSTIKFLLSADGITGWAPYGGVFATPACGEFDDGSVNRPRLVKDPDYSTNQGIHMFYSAYEWGGTETVRYCGRIGHAISYDDGLSWQRAGAVFESRLTVGGSGQDWDSNQVLKPSLVVEPCPSGGSALRLFYEGKPRVPTVTVTGGLGFADATWPFTDPPEPPCSVGMMIALNEQPAPDAEGSIARLTSAPNPTRGTTTIQVDFSRAQVAGEAELTIIDVTGRLLRHLWTGSSLTAPHTIEWDGRESGGARVAPGRYLARMRLGDTTAGSHWITITR